MKKVEVEWSDNVWRKRKHEEKKQDDEQCRTSKYEKMQYQKEREQTGSCINKMIKKWSHKKALKGASSMDMKVKRREGRCVEGKEGVKLSF